jgi:hypothetical protein
MFVLVKLGSVVAVAGILAAGLVPPLIAQGALDTDAVNAARSASAALVGSSYADTSAAQVAADASVEHDPGVEVVRVTVQGATVEVTLSETVHTFMEGVPGLKKYFHLTSTRSSTLGE